MVGAMANSTQQQVDQAYGFLTTVDSPSHGLFGGYLIVDLEGRPLEFHCTAPVRVSRAQQILYGATLHGHLHGRQIGGTLLAEGGVVPRLVLTDQEPLLQARPHTQLPLALVTASQGAEQAGPTAHAGFNLGSLTVVPHATDRADETVLREHLEGLIQAVDLNEPFERIRAAIEEAQRH